MFVGISSVEIFLPDNHSLKDKRQAIKKIVEKARSRFNISIIEVNKSNLWQKACVGFSVVGENVDQINRIIEDVHSFIESLYIGKVIDTRTEIIKMGNEI
ncbi:MAG: DUF503 domain-containing protein [Desulfobacterota bacterium]|nr:DUF503 domain-containing protein [Thermodesulfobacteriota bacterium]MDW8001918.1 DUF503 domain-containing protein [Deltaproteobacteria bacterium]